MQVDPYEHYQVKAKLAILDKNLKLAETIYLDHVRFTLKQGKVDEAMEMYQSLHQWDMSVKLAEKKNHPQLDALKKNYFEWLMATGQLDKGGK